MTYFQRRWKGVWSKFWCFGTQKRGKQIVPTSQIDDPGGAPREWMATGPGQMGGLSLAPPSSPASITNSSIQSPVSFSLPLSASANMCSPGPTKLMFTIGPYAHETQLVSPPVFSTFTTEPSTASLTPPPELAHVTTPSSPDVSFAQLLASSLERKAKGCSIMASVSPLSLPSPGEAALDPKTYKGSISGWLVSPPSGHSDSGAPSPFSDMGFSARFNASLLIRSRTFCTGEIYQQRGGMAFIDPTLLKHERQTGSCYSGELNVQNVMRKPPQKVQHACTYEYEAGGAGSHGATKLSTMGGYDEGKIVPFVLPSNSQMQSRIMDQDLDDAAIPEFQNSCAASLVLDHDMTTVSDHQGFSSLFRPSMCSRREFMSVHFDTSTENESRDSPFSSQEAAQDGLDVQGEGFMHSEESLDDCTYTSFETKSMQLEDESGPAVLPLSPALQSISFLEVEIDGETLP